MLFFGKQLSKISIKDIHLLIENGNIENKELEFKKELSLQSDSEKKEFLADISAFLNSSGGYIIFGLDEENGRAKEIIGIHTENIDALKNRIDNIIRDGLEPMNSYINIKEILLKENEYVIIIEIPKSWYFPVMVTYQNTSRFYGRNSSGKFQLDYQEIKQRFIQSDTAVKRIRDFRLERINKIFTNDSPIIAEFSPAIVLHCIPISSFTTLLENQLKIDNEEFKNFRTFFETTDNHRYNLDGILITTQAIDDSVMSYTQIFRNGVIEAVDYRCLNSEYPNEKYKIPVFVLRDRMNRALMNSVDLFIKNGISAPIIVFVSLLGVKGFTIGLSRTRDWGRLEKQYNVGIREDIINLDEIIIDSFDSFESQSLTKQVLDRIWNAVGWPKAYEI
jgi:hypothetical protein